MKRSFNRLIFCHYIAAGQSSMSSFHNAMELPGIPDAKEPDGPEDGIVVLENNLGAAIEATLDQEVKVLYPRKSWIFGITRASDKLMKVHCRDDPSIFGTRRVEDGLTLGASESFGSFGVQVADFLQKDREEVERERSLLQERKRKMEKELEKRRLVQLSVQIPFFFSCTVLFLGVLVLWTCLDPEDAASAVLLCLLVVLSLASLCCCNFFALTSGLRCLGPRRKVLAHYGSYGCFFLGSLTVTIAIVRFVMAGFWWTVLAAGLPCCCMSAFMGLGCRPSSEMAVSAFERLDKQAVANRTIVFHGKVRPGTGKCVCSWPGKYESAWDALVTRTRRGNISAVVVFLPEGSEHFGSHDVIPEEERLQGSCWCVPLYGEQKPWGCRWWTKWIANIESARREGAEMEVYFFKGMKGRGKVKDFSTAGEENLRREAIQVKIRHFLRSQAFSSAYDGGIEGLWQDPRGDSSSQFSREMQRLFLAWLPQEERRFIEASEGLGNSQKAEVAWLERKGYAYTEVEVDISQWLQ